MPNPFPTPEYIDACRKAAEEGWLKWEYPEEGDWYIFSQVPHCLNYRDATEIRQTFRLDPATKERYIFLPSRRQLEERLEEEGCAWFLGRMDELKEDEVGGPAESDYRCVADGIDTMASSPELALLRALEAVVKREKPVG